MSQLVGVPIGPNRSVGEKSFGLPSAACLTAREFAAHTHCCLASPTFRDNMARCCASPSPRAQERLAAPCTHASTPRLAAAPATLKAAFGHQSRHNSSYHSVVEAPSHRRRAARAQAAEAAAAAPAVAVPPVLEAPPLPLTQLVYSGIVFEWVVGWGDWVLPGCGVACGQEQLLARCSQPAFSSPAAAWMAH